MGYEHDPHNFSREWISVMTAIVSSIKSKHSDFGFSLLVERGRFLGVFFCLFFNYTNQIGLQGPGPTSKPLVTVIRLAPSKILSG